MKKLTSIILIFIILLAVLCGCQSNRESYKNEFDCNTDFQYIYNNMNTMPAPITMSPSGYYVILYDFLYYVDKESMKGIVLCDKPNCMHNDRDECMAYFHVNSYTTESNILQYYKDNLYIMENVFHNNEYYGEVLHKLSPEGASRKDVLTIKGNVCQWLIHRGYLYYITSDMEMNENGVPVYNSFVIYRLSMDNLGGRADVVFDSGDEYKDISYFRSFSAYRDFLYINIVKYEASTDYSYTLILNLSDSSVHNLNDYFTSPYIQSFYEDKIIVSDTDKTDNLITYMCDLSGDNKEEVAQFKNKNIICDGKYFYNLDNLSSANIKRIEVFDKEYKVIDSFELPFTDKNKPIYSLLPQDEKAFIFWEQSNTDLGQIGYIDKTKIGTYNGAVAEYKVCADAVKIKNNQSGVVAVD